MAKDYWLLYAGPYDAQAESRCKIQCDAEMLSISIENKGVSSLLNTTPSLCKASLERLSAARVSSPFPLPSFGRLGDWLCVTKIFNVIEKPRI